MVFIGIVLFLFISGLIIVGIDNGYVNSLEKEILDNTDINDIQYVNKYDGYYLVEDKEYLYLLNNNYEQITSMNLNLIHNNSDNYDIVYRDQTIMYMDSYKNEEGIIFKYYDIYTYQVIDEIIVGGN